MVRWAWRNGWSNINRKSLIFFFGIASLLLIALTFYPPLPPCYGQCGESKDQEPFIFIGGYPRSGTTLMRVLLDVHPSIRCGPETHILPLFLHLHSTKIVPLQKERLPLANISEETVDAIYMDIIHSLLHKTGPRADRLCVKDPFIDTSIQYLLNLFPNSKFILMVRDGRAVVNSIMSRAVHITGLNITDPDAILNAWNKHYDQVNWVCESAERCTVVKYEQLVLRPRTTLTALLKWLNIAWHEAVMRHDEKVNEVALSKKEKSTTQVVFPVYTDALGEWAKPGSKINNSVMQHASSLKMMKFFGYSGLKIPPVYGIPEPEVEARANELHNNADFRQLFKSLH